MKKNVVGVFLPENLTRVVHQVVRAQDALNVLSRAELPPLEVLELSQKAKAEVSEALDTLELILAQLNRDEFRAA